MTYTDTFPSDEDDYGVLEQRWVVLKSRFSDDEWLAAFRRHRLPARLRPRGPVTAYRGATVQGKRGMSWTTDRATAQKYAGASGHVLWTTRIPPRAVLAVIASAAGWSEIVVDPDRLGEVGPAPPERGAGGGLAMRRGMALLREQCRADELARQRRAEADRKALAAERFREAVRGEQRRPARQAPGPPRKTPMARMIEEERARRRSNRRGGR